MAHARNFFTAALLVAAVVRTINAAEHAFRVEVSAGDFARRQTPVAVDVVVPPEMPKVASVTLVAKDGSRIAGQLTPLDDPETPRGFDGEPPDGTRHQLHFILPSMESGATAEYAVTLSDSEPADGPAAADTFHWVDTSRPQGADDASAEESRELRFGDRPVVRFMHTSLDERTPASRAATYKPYHHVYDPSGKRFLTKGPGGIFPHHRGLFFGFNRVTYGDGLQADVWHNTKGESQRFGGMVSEDVGPVLGRHSARITWHGRDGQAFAEETRSLTAYNVPGGTLLEWSTRLRSLGATIRLDGDPQHAGFHFRATQDVPDTTSKQTYYVRPDGKGSPGAFRNWPGQREHVNLEWLAVSFVVDGARYTCCYLDRPTNPKEARFSERDYGRFGSYFEYELTPDRPLEIAYRLWLAEGEMDVPQIAAIDRDFVSPPVVSVVP